MYKLKILGSVYALITYIIIRVKNKTKSRIVKQEKERWKIWQRNPSDEQSSHVVLYAIVLVKDEFCDPIITIIIHQTCGVLN